jgi:mRNA interferase YafQ
VLTPVWSGRFKRDVRRAEKRGKDMEKLKSVLSLLLYRIEGSELQLARTGTHADLFDE